MVVETSQEVHRLINKLYQGKYVDEMTNKWLSLTPNPPRIPEFYPLTKIHKPKLLGRPIVSGCEGPTAQKSYLKDTTDFNNFIEKTKVAENLTLVSMDVISLYANIPQEEGIDTVCKEYGSKPPIPNQYLREILRLIL